MLVDDEPDFRFSASVALRKAGFDVVESGDGLEALSRLIESRGRGEQVSLLVTDIRMPAMSGLELVDEMKRVGIDIPVFVITGIGERSLLADLAGRGCAELLEKPFEPQEMVSRISLFLQKHDRGIA